MLSFAGCAPGKKRPEWVGAALLGVSWPAHKAARAALPLGGRAFLVDRMRCSAHPLPDWLTLHELRGAYIAELRVWRRRGVVRAAARRNDPREWSAIGEGLSAANWIKFAPDVSIACVRAAVARTKRAPNTIGVHAASAIVRAGRANDAELTELLLTAALPSHTRSLFEKMRRGQADGACEPRSYEFRFVAECIAATDDVTSAGVVDVVAPGRRNWTWNYVRRHLCVKHRAARTMEWLVTVRNLRMSGDWLADMSEWCTLRTLQSCQSELDDMWDHEWQLLLYRSLRNPDVEVPLFLWKRRLCDPPYVGFVNQMAPCAELPRAENVRAVLDLGLLPPEQRTAVEFVLFPRDDRTDDELLSVARAALVHRREDPCRGPREDLERRFSACSGSLLFAAAGVHPLQMSCSLSKRAVDMIDRATGKRVRLGAREPLTQDVDDALPIDGAAWEARGSLTLRPTASDMIPKNTLATFPPATTGAVGWGYGVLAPNGKLYFMPNGRRSVLIVDPVDNTADTTSIVFPVGSPYINAGQWGGAVVAPNGKIYCSPFWADCVLIVDPVQQTLDWTTIRGGAGFGTYNWGAPVLGANGRIYCVPFNADRVLVVDPSTNTLSGISFGVPMIWDQWNAGALGLNGKIYAPPMKAGGLLVIDPEAATATQVAIPGMPVGDLERWASAVTAPNGDIYCAAYDATMVLIIHPADNTTDVGSITGLGAQTEKWPLAVLAPSGRIYCVSASLSTYCIIDPATNTADLASIAAAPLVGSWGGAAVAENGKIYVGPGRNCPGLLVIKTGLPAAAPDWLLLPEFNRA